MRDSGIAKVNVAPFVQTSPTRLQDEVHALPVLSCRRITDADIGAAVALLTQGFPARPKAYWVRALDRLRRRPVPDGRPRFGYGLIDRGRLVGIVLLIFAESDQGAVRGNVSSWYVEPDYRGFSHILLSTVLKVKGITLFNVSPAPSTIQTIEAQGFVRYVAGTFLSISAVAPSRPDAIVKRIVRDSIADAVLMDHVRWGCLAFEVVEGGVSHPFVFVRQRFLHGRVPCAHLLYCHHVDDFVRFAGPLGRRLLRSGIAVVAIDANGPLEGLRGVYRHGRTPKFFCGPSAPRLGDLSYTELAMFEP